jgi:hypothetical protein
VASILASVARCLAGPEFFASESWVHPANPIPNPVLVGFVDAIDEDVSSRTDYEYLAIKARQLLGEPLQSGAVP